MASIRKNNSANTSTQKQTTNKKVEISWFNKVSFDNRPSLLGYFSAVVEGYPICSRVNITEREDESFGVAFPSRPYEDKNTHEKKYSDYLHPISKEVREAFCKAGGSLMEDIYSDDNYDSNYGRHNSKYTKDNTFDKENIQFAYENKKEVETWPALLGDASFTTELQMALHQMELHKNKNGEFFVAYPARHVKQDDGSYEDYPFIVPGSP